MSERRVHNRKGGWWKKGEKKGFFSFASGEGYPRQPLKGKEEEEEEGTFPFLCPQWWAKGVREGLTCENGAF